MREGQGSVCLRVALLAAHPPPTRDTQVLSWLGDLLSWLEAEGVQCQGCSGLLVLTHSNADAGSARGAPGSMLPSTAVVKLGQGLILVRPRLREDW